jgi:hypothetical protein
MRETATATIRARLPERETRLWVQEFVVRYNAGHLQTVAPHLALAVTGFADHCCSSSSFAFSEEGVDSDAKCNTCNLLVQRMIFDLAPKTVADSPGFESLPASSRLEPPSIAAL